MIYTKLVRKACDILYEAHKDDRDKGGYPYVFHPFYLATQMDSEYSTCVALLHDVIEDHSDTYSFESLEKEGFPTEIISALRLLTHKEGVPYMEYIKTIKTNDIATKVKIADLKHNLNSDRTDGVLPSKYDTYVKALKYLSDDNDRY